jgi:hypothetical protein
MGSALVAVGKQLLAPLDKHGPAHASGEASADLFRFLVGEHGRG